MTRRVNQLAQIRLAQRLWIRHATAWRPRGVGQQPSTTGVVWPASAAPLPDRSRLRLRPKRSDGAPTPKHSTTEASPPWLPDYRPPPPPVSPRSSPGTVRKGPSGPAALRAELRVSQFAQATRRLMDERRATVSRFDCADAAGGARIPDQRHVKMQSWRYAACFRTRDSASRRGRRRASGNAPLDRPTSRTRSATVVGHVTRSGSRDMPVPALMDRRHSPAAANAIGLGGAQGRGRRGERMAELVLKRWPVNS